MPAVHSKPFTPIYLAVMEWENLEYKVNELMDMSFDEKNNFPSEQKYLTFNNNLMFINKKLKDTAKEIQRMCRARFSYITQEQTNDIIEGVAHKFQEELQSYDRFLQMTAKLGYYADMNIMYRRHRENPENTHAFAYIADVVSDRYRHGNPFDLRDCLEVKSFGCKPLKIMLA